MVFRDRVEAGKALAARVAPLRPARPLVLGLARGGVPVAAEVARALGCELDVLVVRKLGAPAFPEFAVGAVAEGGAAYLNPDAVRDLGLDDAEVSRLADRAAVELARRVQAYREGRPAPDLAGRTAVVVDDGIATGATARAACRAARALGAERVVLAAPVLAADSEAALRRDADDVVAVERPEAFYAVGAWYERFEQLEDADVLAVLRAARAGASAPARAGPDGDPAAAEGGALRIPYRGARCGPGALDATLAVPAGARGLVLFVHGSGSSRRSPRNRRVAAALGRSGFATLLFDLLTPEEAEEDARTERFRFDVDLLACRVAAVARWARDAPRVRGMPLVFFGASTGAAAALVAAAEAPEAIAAIVSRGGRPDLVREDVLRRVRAPVLLVVGGRDASVLALNRAALPALADVELAVVPGATHLFEEPGALDAVVRLAAEFLERRAPAAPGPEVRP